MINRYMCFLAFLICYFAFPYLEYKNHFLASFFFRVIVLMYGYAGSLYFSEGNK